MPPYRTPDATGGKVPAKFKGPGFSLTFSTGNCTFNETAFIGVWGVTGLHVQRQAAAGFGAAGSPARVPSVCPFKSDKADCSRPGDPLRQS